MCGVYSRRHLPLPTLESLETSLSLLFMLWGARVLDIPIPTLTCEKRKQNIKLKTGDVGAWSKVEFTSGSNSVIQRVLRVTSDFFSWI